MGIIIFSLSREQIRPIQVMRSLLLLSFLLLVLFAALSPTMAKHNPSYPRCASECCRRCQYGSAKHYSVPECRNGDMMLRGCSKGYYCDRKCRDPELFDI